MNETLTAPNDPWLARIKLRAELEISLRTEGSTPYVLLRDPVLNHYYRLGIEEWKIVTCFDGNRTIRNVVASTADPSLREVAIPTEVYRLARWLVDNGLAESVAGSLDAESAADGDERKKWTGYVRGAGQLGKWNPLFLRITLPNPSAWLAPIKGSLAWLLSAPAFAVWLMLCAWGAYGVTRQWDRFCSSLHNVLAAENWLWLLVIWLILKLWHEIGHAVACLKYGGSITRWGLMFILFSPIAWVDVTDAWRFRSKWQRIVVSVAGMYFEFLVAAAAAIVWSQTKSPFVATISRNILVAATATTVLFNLNVLMRFDGYYILADAIGVQNLYGLGQRHVHAVGRRLLLGLPITGPDLPTGKGMLIKLYGLAALVWRFVFCAGILVVAARMFDGAGVVLALFSGLAWFAAPLSRLTMLFCCGHQSERPSRRRLGLMCVGALGAGAVALMVPWPGNSLAYGVVDFAPLHTIRVNSPGFVHQIVVEPGQRVRQGDLLLRLENSEIVRRLEDIQLQIQAAEIRRRVQHRDSEMAQHAATEKQLTSLQEKRAQLTDSVRQLEIRAPIDGVVLTGALASYQDKYVEMGEELLAIGATSAMEIYVAISQQNVAAFRESIGATAKVAFRGGDSPSDAKLIRIKPKASRRVIYSSLAATSGGPLAVQPNQSEGKDAAGQGLLVEPHFEGILALDAEQLNRLRAGQVCRVSLGRGHLRLYEGLWHAVRSYLETKSAGT